MLDLHMSHERLGRVALQLKHLATNWTHFIREHLCLLRSHCGHELRCATSTARLHHASVVGQHLIGFIDLGLHELPFSIGHGLVHDGRVGL